MSELLDRARALGAPQDFLDELMDMSEPRQALLDMLLERTKEKEEGELGALVASLRKDAAVLATAARVPQKHEERHVRPLQTLSTMIELSTARADVALELASMHVPEVAAAMMQDAFEADGDAVNAVVLPPAMLLLATLAAHQDCHAWFTGSGTVAAIVGALNLETETEEEAELLPLACSALANLAAPPSGSEPGRGAEGSTAVAKEILAAGGLVPLIELVARGYQRGDGGGGGGGGVGPAPASREHGLRSQQWAAAALCNFSQHGDRAREVLIRRGVLKAAVAGLHRLTAEAAAVAAAEEALPSRGGDGVAAGGAEAAAAAAEEEEGRGGARGRGGGGGGGPAGLDLAAAASAGGVIELLLGCLANLAPHKPQEVLEGGAIEAALHVLAEAPLHQHITRSGMANRLLQTAPGVGAGAGAAAELEVHPMHDAATALIRHTAEAAMPQQQQQQQQLELTTAAAFDGGHDDEYPDIIRSSGTDGDSPGGSSGSSGSRSDDNSRGSPRRRWEEREGEAVPLLPPPPQLQSLSDDLASIARARPELGGTVISELLGHVDVINKGEISDECSLLLIELEQLAEERADETRQALALAGRSAEEVAAEAERERLIEAVEAEAAREAAAAAAEAAAAAQEEDEEMIRRYAAAAEANRVKKEQERAAAEAAAAKRAEVEAAAQEEAGRLAKEEEEARKAAEAEAEAVRVERERLRAEKIARRAERTAARALAKQQRAEAEAQQEEEEWTGEAQREAALVSSEILNIDITRFSGPMLARILAARAVERDRFGLN